MEQKKLHYGRIVIFMGLLTTMAAGYYAGL